jgi:UDP-glucose 4-epimerase
VAPPDSGSSAAAVALTGARGFIGSWLAEALQRAGNEVVVLAGDVRSPVTYEGDYDALFHLASPLPRHFSASPREAEEVSAVGLALALQACEERGARLVFPSTAGVYAPRSAPAPEEAPKAPRSPYARAKWRAERVCAEAAASQRLKVTILRPFNIYGPRQAHGILRSLVAALRSGEELLLRTPSSVRDFLFVADFVRAAQQVLDVPDPFCVFNVGSGAGTSIRELARALGLAAGASVPVREGGQDDPLPDVSVADISAIQAACGWEPRTGLLEGLRQTLSAPPDQPRRD